MKRKHLSWTRKNTDASLSSLSRRFLAFVLQRRLESRCNGRSNHNSNRGLPFFLF